VLKAASERISGLLEEGDVFARLGGDEFAILRLERSTPTEVGRLADEILNAMTQELDLDGHTAMVGVSIGVAMFPEDGGMSDVLMRNADAALYKAKGDGRGVYRFFEAELGAELRQRQAMEFDLRQALPREELRLLYQPQTDIRTGKTFGFEALVRWTSQQRGTVSPAVFIPIAEETGMILQIGEWVLREACREAASWPEPLQIAVNVSGVQLRSPNLASLVHQVLLETGLPAERLELEITETAMVDDFQRALHTLRQVKALGVKVAMDDFGTGYSSLSNLRAFPFDKLKIDQSFVRNVGTSEEAGAIVRAIVGLAKGLNLKVLAEGVETEQELAFLDQELCAEAQGYLFGRPGEIVDFAVEVGRVPAKGRRGVKAA
jgi:predicted signal transduction protein with EAL and GGDEF domain